MKIAIIGAGIGGLSCLHSLNKQTNNKLDITLFESSDRAGGRICSYHIKGYPTPIELGAGYFHKYYLNLNNLIKEFGLEKNVALKGSGRIGFVKDDNIISLSKIDIIKNLFTGKLNLNDIRSLFSLQRYAAQGADNLSNHVIKILAGDSHEDIHHILLQDTWYKQAYYRSTYEFSRKLSPTIQAFLEALSEKQTFQSFRTWKDTVGIAIMCSAAVKLYSLSSGMDSLPQAIAQKYAANIKFNSKIISCQYIEDRKKWEITSDTGSVGHFDIVVFSLPVPIINQIAKLQIPLEYATGRILIVRGILKSAYSGVNNLYVINDKDGVTGITHYGPGIFKIGVKEQYNLTRFFDQHEIVLEHHWNHATAKLTPQVPYINNNIAPQAYLVGDYFLPSMEASIDTGINVATRIVALP